MEVSKGYDQNVTRLLKSCEKYNFTGTVHNNLNCDL